MSEEGQRIREESELGKLEADWTRRLQNGESLEGLLGRSNEASDKIMEKLRIQEVQVTRLTHSPRTTLTSQSFRC